MSDKLEIQEIEVRFDGLVALQGVSFTLSPGEICGLIGPNGAGKTTLINVMTGFQRPSSGQVLLGGARISVLSPEKVARLGIGRTFQAVRLFKAFTVRENLLAYAVGNGRSTREAEGLVATILEGMKLVSVAEDRADTLPYGVERRVGIARALAGSPRYLLLDEPAAGLNEEECDELMELIRAVPGKFNCSILLIEHNMRLVMNACGRICVIDFGRKIAEGTPAEIMTNQLVRDAYLGAEMAAL